LNEISTTGGVAGYLTPKAFSATGQNNTDRVKAMAKRIGYSLTHRGSDDAKRVDKMQEKVSIVKKQLTQLTENYYKYRNDDSALPHQKIGKAISEINKQLKMVERVLHYNNRLKNEYGVSNESLWKRTQNQMTKLEGRLIEIARRLREMRG
jgi:septation ring formation regulator EzrA